jgi:Glu-tRNA(Gln) amidotransferase subunit E-like FAD-binding protein
MGKTEPFQQENITKAEFLAAVDKKAKRKIEETKKFEDTQLTEEEKEMLKKVFRRLAEAYYKKHGAPLRSARIELKLEEVSEDGVSLLVGNVAQYPAENVDAEHEKAIDLALLLVVIGAVVVIMALVLLMATHAW